MHTCVHTDIQKNRSIIGFTKLLQIIIETKQQVVFSIALKYIIPKKFFLEALIKDHLQNSDNFICCETHVDITFQIMLLRTSQIIDAN